MVIAITESLPANSNGIPAALASRLNYLSNLLKNLPKTLPFNPPQSRYNFYFDEEDIEEEGLWYAFNRNLEVCFETHTCRDGQIVLRERGACYGNLMKMFQRMLREDAAGRDWVQEQWLERLIEAAKLAGATVQLK